MTFKKFIWLCSERIPLACIFASVALPLLVVHSSLFPYVFPKAIVFEGLTLVGFFVHSFSLLVGKAFVPMRVIRHPVTIAFALMIAIFVLSALVGVDFERSFWSTAERMNGVFFYLTLFLYLIMCSVSLRTDAHWDHLIFVSLAVSILVAMSGLFEVSIVAAGGRLSTSFGNPLYASLYAIIHCIFAAFTFFRVRGRNPSLSTFLIFAFIANILVIYFAAARSAYLTLLLVIAYCSFHCYRLHFDVSKNRPAIKRTLIGVMTIFTLSVGVYGAVTAFGNAQVLPHFDRIRSSLFNDSERIALWRIGFRGFIDRPLFGWGHENLAQVIQQKWSELPDRRHAVVEIFDRSHNIFIDSLLSTGIIGTSACLFLWFCLFRRVIFSVRPNQGASQTEYAHIALSALIIAYGFFHLFSIETPVLLVFFALFLAFFIYLDDPAVKTTLKKRTTVRHKIAPLLFGILSIFLLAGLLYGVIKPFSASRISVRAYALSAIDPNRSISMFRQALDLNTFLDDSVRLAEVKAAMQILSDRSAHVLPGVKEFVAFAIDSLEKGSARRPALLAWYVTGGQIYSEAMAFDKQYASRGKELLGKGLALVPEHPILRHALSRIYLTSGDYRNALVEVDRAIHSFSSEPAYYLTRIEILLGLERTDEAFANFSAVQADHPVNANQASIIAAVLKKIPCGFDVHPLKNYLERAVELFPADLNFRIANILYDTINGRGIEAQAHIKEIEIISSNAALIVRNDIKSAVCKQQK